MTTEDHNLSDYNADSLPDLTYSRTNDMLLLWQIGMPT